MKITQSNFFTLLAGIKQYQIPIYQRNYAWGLNDCKRLLEDIIKTGTPGNPNHYVGSVIVKEETMAGGVELFNVIDGQQRTTSITLLLLALKEYWSTYNNKAGVDSTIAMVVNALDSIYLLNQALSNTGLHMKLLPKDGSDRKEYENLLHGVVGSGKISNNYRFFLQELKNKTINPTVIFNGITNAQVALVKLDSNENPQLLFEAVNDTGVDLTEVDLIRNWVFMGLPRVDQDRLYRAYWEPIEKQLPDQLGTFFYYYVQMKSETRIDDTYKAFKKLFLQNMGDSVKIEELLKNIKAFVDIYVQYSNNSISDPKLKKVLGNIVRTGKNVYLPLILKVVNLWKTGAMPLQDAVKLFTYLESYIVRRDILDLPTRSNGEAMFTMLKNCSTLSGFTSKIASLTYAQRMPSDVDMHTQLQLKDFYSASPQNAYYYLERIEKDLNPGFSLTDPTVEHILPETMHTYANPKKGVNSAKVDDYNWEIDLGQNAPLIHEKYQHTLGNLTILPRSENSRMGDYRFHIKRDWPAQTQTGFNYGYASTPIRISQSLRFYSKWDENAILDRCKMMVDHICRIWPHP